jgi:serine/threonine-protein kinase
MTTESADRRYARLVALFESAADVPRALRSGYLREACADDPTLRAEVEQLLAAHEGNGVLDALAPMIPDRLSDALGEPSMPDRVGPFDIVGLIGSGGMGDVYRARRASDGFEQQVALKILRTGAADRGMLQRFIDERRILATLEHPGITRFIDGGITDDGVPYLAMEFVRGETILRYCRERRAGVAERLRLIIAVCDAIQYAHQRLVVHRDIKPTNVLVTEAGGVKVLDFGIAKVLGAGGDRAATATGQRWMTLDYASPEQIRGDAITTAADIFAIGVLTYELLTGRKPHGGDARIDVERAILEQDPPAPSSLVDDQRAGEFGTTRRTLQRELAGDLDTIVLKALAKQPSRRFVSAAELADDLNRYLNGLPVRARPDSAAYRTRKFIRRHRRLVAALSLGAAGIIGGGITAAVAMRRAQVNAAREARERARAEVISRFVVGLFAGIDPLSAGRDSMTAREMLDSGAARVRRDFANDPATRAALLDHLSTTYEGVGRITDAVATNVDALAAIRAAQPVDSVELARALTTRARLLVLIGSADSARDVARAALAVAQAVNRTSQAAEQLRLIGSAFAATGHADSAEHYLNLAAAKGANDTSFAFRDAVLDDRTSLLAHRRDLPALEATFDSLRAWRALKLGPRHPQTAIALSMRGETRLNLGRASEAMRDLENARAMLASVVGERHPYVATMRYRLGTAALALNDLPVAAENFRASATTMGELYGPTSAYRARPLASLGDVLIRLGRPKEAVPPIEEALAIWSASRRAPKEAVESARKLLTQARGR